MRIIDIDGHVREADDLWERYLEPPFRARAPKVQRVANGQLLFFLEGNRYHRKPEESPFEIRRDDSAANPHRERGMDPAARLRDMDLEGIEAGMLFPSAALYLPSVEEEPYAVALCRAYNNWLFDYSRADPKRLFGVGIIPVQDIRAAVEEARRAALELGFRGIFVRPNPVKGRTLDDSYYDPLYGTVQDLGIPLMVHEGSGAYLPTAGADRFPGQWFFTHTVSHPFEQMLACLSLTCKGVLEKFPQLKVVFLESGAGWLPYWLWRMDEHYEKLRFQVPWLKMKPSEYFRRQCYISCEPDEDNLGAIVQSVGEERVLFASDYPHWDSIFPGAPKALLDRTDLSIEAKRKILGENALRLLGV